MKNYNRYHQITIINDHQGYPTTPLNHLSSLNHCPTSRINCSAPAPPHVPAPQLHGATERPGSEPPGFQTRSDSVVMMVLVMVMVMMMIMTIESMEQRPGWAEHV
jgi:hypothetical protein